MTRRRMRPAGVMPGGFICGAAAGAAAAGAAAVVVAAGISSAIAAIDVLQFGASLAALFCRQPSASGPPGATPLQ